MSICPITYMHYWVRPPPEFVSGAVCNIATRSYDSGTVLQAGAGSALLYSAVRLCCRALRLNRRMLSLFALAVAVRVLSILSKNRRCGVPPFCQHRHFLTLVCFCNFDAYSYSLRGLLLAGSPGIPPKFSPFSCSDCLSLQILFLINLFATYK